ncbi:MAG: hypothetical protein K2N81_00785 [Acetatifactor sp.]|nr:hypothetical protein [Acetatifactor sp.]
MKRLTAILLVCGVLCVSLTSCGRPSDRIGQESVSAAIESDVQAAPGMNDDNLPSAGDGNAQGLSEDYVYDYQVSMEPIPKEIADLGGPCQGTIHAFPSKIRMGLTQKMMEEDPELKAEVEKRIPEIEQALADNIGGEFRVDEVIAEDVLDWYWFCTEIETGYQFRIRYSNYEYFTSQTEYTITSDNMILFEDYYDEKEAEKVETVYAQVIQKSFGECCNRIWFHSSSDSLTIYIIQFTDNEIDKTAEQLKLLNLWSALKEYNDIRYDIDMLYYPVSYKEVIEQKFNDGNLYDFTIFHDEELLRRGELIARFDYMDGYIEENERGLDLWLEDYETGKYDEDLIWSFWCSE